MKERFEAAALTLACVLFVYIAIYARAAVIVALHRLFGKKPSPVEALSRSLENVSILSK